MTSLFPGSLHKFPFVEPAPIWLEVELDLVGWYDRSAASIGPPVSSSGPTERPWGSSALPPPH